MNQEILAIDVQNLSKSFNGLKAVKDLALQVKRGEIFGFLGPNGSGKTTTLRMLCGLLIPDSGKGNCLGYDILTDTRQIKLHVGYMTQRFSLYDELTILENLDFIARIYNLSERKKRVETCLAQIGLTDRANQLAATLSGGWKQRLALAAALLHEPQLLLLDEPTAGVDPQERRQFWNHLHELSDAGVTTLVSTHYMDEAERCHRLAFIDHGVLLTYGTSEDIIQKMHLTTWIVTGENLGELVNDLQGLSGIEQVTHFGNSLHVSGRDKNLLDKTLAPFRTRTGYEWKLIESSIEDVFISLAGKSEKVI